MKKIFIIIIFSILSSWTFSQAQVEAGNSSVSAKKQDNGYYTITIKDPQGLKSFSLKSAGNLPYSGDLKNCPRVFVVDNVNPLVINDFSGEVDADIVDCQDNGDELEMGVIGEKKSVVGKHVDSPVIAVSAEAVVTTSPSGPVAVAPEPKTAGESAEIVYPISELGNCTDKSACKVYCEEPENMKSCLNFAENHKLISKKEAEEGRKFSSIVNSRGGGPGGCKTRESCEAYCENTDNIETCLAFAESNDLVDEKDLGEMRKVAKLLKEGEKFPGGCKSKSQCEAYCSEPDNMETCLIFAEKAGFIPPEELEMAKKVVPLMKSGKTPGGCRSKESCESYCENPDHLDACIAFGEQTGAISPKDIEIIKKTGGKGPGGCRGKQQCEVFCQNPENQETCFNFGKDNGLIPPEDLQKMEEGAKFITDALNDESSELGQCLSGALGPDNVARAKSGKPILDRNAEGKLKGCFEQFPPGGIGPGGQGGPESQGGPGGCKSQEECQAYCQDHQEECQKFIPQGERGGLNEFRDAFEGGDEKGGDRRQSIGGRDDFNRERSGPPDNFGGPGGCRSQQECADYCQKNPDACKDFGGSQQGQRGPSSEEMDRYKQQYQGGPEGAPGALPPDFAPSSYIPSPEDIQRIQEQYQQQYQYLQ